MAVTQAHFSRTLLMAFTILLICLFTPSFASAQVAPPRAPASSYHVVHGWPVLPVGSDLGLVSGCAVDSKNNVFILHRNDRSWPQSGKLLTKPIEGPTVTLLDGRSGQVLSQWGANLFAMPHGLSVDAQDDVWITDVALQQVYKFSREGKLLLTLGRRARAGSDKSHFNRPTKVAVARDGSFYVSDGYINTRVVKFSPEGAFQFQWGTKGKGPGEFDLPHAVALDQGGRVYVSDRSNARVQIFDAAGKYISEWKGAEIGRPYDLAFASDGTAFIADGGDPGVLPNRSGVAVVGADGKFAERFGRWGYYDGQFHVAHCIAVAHDGSVYVGDAGDRIQKFVPSGR